MSANSGWRAYFDACDQAVRRGEEISIANDVTTSPVDVFRILREERRLILPAGKDFGDAFDGRIKYVGPRFLLCYNTKYNRMWKHTGDHHSKVLFTIAHELGHFFLDHHRRSLISKRRPHSSFAEFSSNKLFEAEADHFACGLLMPRHLLAERVNRSNFHSIGNILEARSELNVSLTGLLARWTQLSDFPCATIVTAAGKILYGWVSAALRDKYCFRVNRDVYPECEPFRRFLSRNNPVQSYADGSGYGSTYHWLDWDDRECDTSELYFAIPHTNQIWVHIMCEERDLEDDRFD